MIPEIVADKNKRQTKELLFFSLSGIQGIYIDITTVHFKTH
jgi:hypothetical protein